MPIYEYICDACGERFSLLRKISEGADDVQCPKCSAFNAKRVMSSFCCSTGGAGSLSSGAPRGIGGGG